MLDKQEQYFLQALKEKDPAGIQSLYDSWFPRILAWIQQNQGNLKEAKDLFQEALIVLYLKVRSPDFSVKVGLFPLFYTICRNLWLKELRKKSRSEVTLSQLDGQLIEDDVKLEDQIHQRDRLLLFQTKLKELHENCQQILRLSWEGKSIREIVALLKMSSEGYARKRKHQCKEQLIKLIQKDPLYQELKKS